MMLALFVLVLFAVLVGLSTRSYWRHAHLYTRLPLGLDAETYEAARFRADLRAARDHEVAGNDYRERTSA
jgi:hypothetical protein